MEIFVVNAIGGNSPIRMLSLYTAFNSINMALQDYDLFSALRCVKLSNCPEQNSILKEKGQGEKLVSCKIFFFSNSLIYSIKYVQPMVKSEHLKEILHEFVIPVALLYDKTHKISTYSVCTFNCPLEKFQRNSNMKPTTRCFPKNKCCVL